jgi:hypothetical protein
VFSALALGVAVVGLALVGRTAAPVFATSGTVSIIPFSGTVAPGATFTAVINQNASVATSGIAVDLTFDKSVLQIVSVTRGSAYPANPDTTYPGGAPWACSPGCGTLIAGIFPQTTADAITEANTTTGVLQNLSVFYAPGNVGEPSVPAGDQEAVIVTMHAIGPVSSSSALTLSDAELIDANGVDPTVTLIGSSVAVATQAASLSVSPSTQNAPENTNFTVSIMETSSVAMSGVAAGLMFDPAHLQVVSVDRGAAWPLDPTLLYGSWLCSPACGTLVSGVYPQTMPQAITDANATGFLRAASVYYGSGSGSEPSVPGGPAVEALHITMHAVTGLNLSEALTLVNAEMVSATGSSLIPGATSGTVVITPGAIDPDGDGCTDAKEMGPNQSLGGQRNPNYYWDFYDVGTNRGGPGGGDENFTKDGKVNFQDALIILDHFGHDGTDAHDHDLDRDVPNPAMPWQTVEGLPGDKVTFTDVLNNLKSFGHSCTP